MCSRTEVRTKVSKKPEAKLRQNSGRAFSERVSLMQSVELTRHSCGNTTKPITSIYWRILWERESASEKAKNGQKPKIRDEQEKARGGLGYRIFMCWWCEERAVGEKIFVSCIACVFVCLAVCVFFGVFWINLIIEFVFNLDILCDFDLLKNLCIFKEPKWVLFLSIIFNFTIYTVCHFDRPALYVY